MRAHAKNTGQPVHKTESTKNSGSPVKLREYIQGHVRGQIKPQIVLLINY